MRCRSNTCLALLALLLAGCGAPPDPAPIEETPYAPPLTNAATFWGHACAYIDVDGLGIVTDPVFDDAYGLIVFRRIPTPAPALYAGARIIIISHAHPDHLSPRTIKTFPDSTVVLCPEPAASHLESVPQTVRIMRPGDIHEIGAITITAVLALHPGGRGSLDAELDGRALGYIIETPELTLYYTGDTDYFDGLEATGNDHRPDLALVNINAHLKSDEAVRAIRAIGAPLVIPLHRGAYFAVNDARSPQWIAQLAAELGDQFLPLEVGESVSFERFERRPPSTAGAR